MAKNKFLHLILLKVKSSHSTLEHTYTQILSDQHLQSTWTVGAVTSTQSRIISTQSAYVWDNMAQSTVKTPLGVPAFWDTGAIPPTDWNTWLGTLKMAIKARDNLQVGKLLKLKPARTELPYSTLPTYEEPFDGETVDKERQRDQRNERRKVDWENECKKLD